MIERRNLTVIFLKKPPCFVHAIIASPKSNQLHKGGYTSHLVLM